MNRFVALVAVIAIVSASSLVWGSTLRYLGAFDVPTDMWGEAGDENPGLSGLAYDPTLDLYYGLSDRGGVIYKLRLDLDQTGIHGMEVVGTVQLDSDQTRSGMQPYDEGNIDPEGLALVSGNTLYVSSEKDAHGMPWIRTFDFEGALLGQITLPQKFMPVGDMSQGVRGDFAFEGLATGGDAPALYVANEQGLYQDYPASTVGRGTIVRIIEYNLSRGLAKVVAEYAYGTEPIHSPPSNGNYALNGVSAIACPGQIMPEYDLLAVERSYASGVGFRIRIFGVDLAEASNITRYDKLPCLCSTRLAAKTLLKSFPSANANSNGPIPPENVEAMTIGPQLGNGHYTLILATGGEPFDTENTSFLAFEVLR